MRSISGRPDTSNQAAVNTQCEVIAAEVAETLLEILKEMPLRGADAFDCDAIEVAIRDGLRGVSGRLVEWALTERVRDCETTSPHCPQCSHPMERQWRRRSLEGLVGTYSVGRNYYRCRRCRTHCIPADTALGLGPGTLFPALSRIAAMTAAQVSFDSAAGSVNEALGTKLTEADVYRTAEALGAVAEAETVAATTQEPATPVQPASDTLLIGADGTTTFRSREILNVGTSDRVWGSGWSMHT